MCVDGLPTSNPIVCVYNTFSHTNIQAQHAITNVHKTPCTIPPSTTFLSPVSVSALMIADVVTASALRVVVVILFVVTVVVVVLFVVVVVVGVIAGVVVVVVVVIGVVVAGGGVVVVVVGGGVVVVSQSDLLGHSRYWFLFNP